MNYADMSDYEINLKVLGKQFGQLGDDKDMVRIWEQGKFQPCNSWADAGPIIESNSISIDAIYEGTTKWLAFCGDDCEFRFVDANPLRAAMIVFLMMQESA